MKFLYRFTLTAIVFFGFDVLWLFVLMKNYYRDQLAFIARLGTDGQLAAWAPPAVIFYLVYVFAVVVLILPRVIEDRRQIWQAALFGFVAYATYDLTNLSTIRDWPLGLTLIDMAWGTFVTSATVLIVTIILARKKS